MKTVIELEFIGEHLWAYEHARQRGSERLIAAWEREFLRPGPAHLMRPWVARLIGLDERFGAAREFVNAQIDYSRANGTGSRGVYLYFLLTPGVYEVNARTSWKSTRRYYIRATDDGRYTEIPREEVESWLLSLRP